MGVDMRMMDSRILGPMGRNGADSRDVVLKVNYFIGLETRERLKAKIEQIFFFEMKD